MNAYDDPLVQSGNRTATEIAPEKSKSCGLIGGDHHDTSFGCPRNFLDNHFVYTVISPRARGLSVGINLNPDKSCNFDCTYCEVERGKQSAVAPLNVEAIREELLRTLSAVQSGRIRDLPPYRNAPADCLRLRQVSLSGDGEPSQCPQFVEVVHAVMHARALRQVPYFKVVLITNSTGLDLPAVQEGLGFFTPQDEVWAKLDAGTQSYFQLINRTSVSLDKILSNIALVGRKRPVTIQSMFVALGKSGPSDAEIQAYAQRLLDLKEDGADISLVQVYSATRPHAHSECEHLPLKVLAAIAQTVRSKTGLRAEVF